MLVSCAVLPSPDTAFSASFQDWPEWLENGTVDYVVLMNYTKNNQLAKEITRSALAHRGKGRVYIGIGNFLMEKDDPSFFSGKDSFVNSGYPTIQNKLGPSSSLRCQNNLPTLSDNIT